MANAMAVRRFLLQRRGPRQLRFIGAVAVAGVWGYMGQLFSVFVCEFFQRFCYVVVSWAFLCGRLIPLLVVCGYPMPLPFALCLYRQLGKSFPCRGGVCQFPSVLRGGSQPRAFGPPKTSPSERSLTTCKLQGWTVQACALRRSKGEPLYYELSIYSA